jgi:phosphoglycolate phosphatase
MTASPLRAVRAILFDLDGTLLDTAPDMTGAVNELLVEEGRAALPFAQLRPHVSHGSHGLVRIAFGDADPVEFQRRRARFLELYAQRLTTATTPFAGIDEVLETLEAAACPWGIVTNKPGWLTEPLLAHLGLARRAACVVSDDTLPERKPHPSPLLHAAAQLQIEAHHCLYVGDAERDMQAAAAAGMAAVIARYGYIGAHDALDSWGAHAQIDHPLELIELAGVARRERARA